MIDVSLIDYWATTEGGTLHRASVPSKLLLLLLVVAAAVTARRPEPLAAAYLLLIVVAFAAGLPWLRLALLSLYAAVFAALYVLTLGGGIVQAVLLVLKAVITAYASLLLIVSTPYPRVFSFLGIFFPAVLVEGLFMTYRSFFILLDLMGNFIDAIRIRGGISPGKIARNGSNIARGIAMLFVRAVERSSRLDAVMQVRGYSGRIAVTKVERVRGEDVLPVMTGVAALLLVLFWR